MTDTHDLRNQWFDSKTEPVQYETPMKNQEILKELDMKIKAAEESLLYLNQAKAGLERVIANSKKSPVEEAFKNNYGVYPNELKTTDDFNCWKSFKRGYNAACEEKVVEEPEQSLKEAFREAVKQGVVSSVDKPEPNNLYDLIADWWDEIFTNGNPSGQNIESLVEQIMKLIPEPLDDTYGFDEYNRGWKRGYNYYRYTLLERFNGK